MLVACDVQTLFVDAAPVFGPQKGASPAQVDMLKGRLHRLAQMYEDEYGVDVRHLPGTGAAGGLAGGLVALGGTLMPGFELVADEIELHDHIAEADLVITGEGYLDEQSFEGKVVGGVQAWALAADKQVGAIVGDATPEVASRIEHVSLVDAYGEARAMNEPLACIQLATATLLERLRS
jgi:glycerate kinase